MMTKFRCPVKKVNESQIQKQISRTNFWAKVNFYLPLVLETQPNCLDLDLNDKRPGATSDNDFMF